MIKKVITVIFISFVLAGIANSQPSSWQPPPATGPTPAASPAPAQNPAPTAAPPTPAKNPSPVIGSSSAASQPGASNMAEDDADDDWEAPSSSIAYEASAKFPLGYEKDVVLVIYDGLASQQQVAQSADEAHHFLQDLYYFDQVNLTLGSFKLKNQTLPKASHHFYEQPIVAWVQPNYLYQTAANNAAVQSAFINWKIHYGLKAVGLDNYLIPDRGKGVAIGLIDSVVQVNHPELQGQSVKQHNILNIPQADTHGTAIASILLGNQKIPGIVPESTLISIPAFGGKHFSNNARQSETERLAQALNVMLKQPVDVVNMSFSGASDPLVETLLIAMMKKGVLLVSAAGNGGESAKPSFPAAYAGVMSVTAVDKNNRVYQHANRGDYIDLSAPGVKVLAATKGRSYGLVTGTSFATAYTTGMAALLKSQGVSNAKIVSMLTTAAKDLGSPGKDPDYGYGLMQAQ